MAKSEIISIRVSKDLKSKSQKIFKSFGMSLSVAVRLFLLEVIKNEGLPFNIKND